MYYELTDSFIVKADLSQTWEFFGNPQNLPRITPRWLHFEVDQANPAEIAQDTVLKYRIKWAGLTLRWRTRIIDWSPMRQFIDLQTKGPYVLWHHQHSFETHPEGTLCHDRVIYKLPVPGLNRVIQRAVIGRQLRAIFEHRRKVIGEELGWVRAVQAAPEVHPLR